MATTHAAHSNSRWRNPDMAVLQRRSDLAPVRVGLVTRTHAPARWRLPLNAYVSRYPRQRRARFFEALNRSKAYVITVTDICHFAGISWDANRSEEHTSELQSL